MIRVLWICFFVLNSVQALDFLHSSKNWFLGLFEPQKDNPSSNDNTRQPIAERIGVQTSPSPSSTYPDFSNIVQKAAPAVVDIFSLHVSENKMINPFMADPFFDNFFKNLIPSLPTQKQVQQSSGSGVIINAQGLLITCAHVVQGASSIKIRLNDGREFKAELITLDKKEDLALLQIKPETPLNFPFVAIGDPDDVQVGSYLIAIGNAFGLGQTVTHGIKSAPLRSVAGKIVLQTDAPINPGNSGGALVNTKGELVAIPNAILSRSGASHGIGFSRPATLARILMQKKEGKPSSWLGIYVQALSDDLAKSFPGGMKPEGVIITNIHEQSPANALGLKKGDIIFALNGHKILTPEDFSYRQQIAPLESPIKLDVWQNNTRTELSITPIAAPQGDQKERFKITGNSLLSGLVIGALSPALAIDLGLSESKKGIVIIETPASAKIPIAPGDVIVQINNNIVQTTDDVVKALQNGGRGFSMLIKRGDQSMMLRVG